MKRYTVKIPPEVETEIRHLHPALKSKIHKALDEIEGEPFLGKPLRGVLKGLWSYRVSHYRIVYEIRRDKVLVEVIDIAERKIIYEQVARAISALR